MGENEYIDEVASELARALKGDGANYAEAVEGDVYVEWYLSDLLEFCQSWRSEIEELG